MKECSRQRDAAKTAQRKKKKRGKGGSDFYFEVT